LFPGDAIEVATFNEGVKVTGNVLVTSEIPYKKEEFEYYLDAVGGVDNKGWKKSHTSFTVDKLQLHVSSYS
jgi:hypothetical protein